MEQNITVVGLDTSKKTLVTGVLLPDMDRVTESKVIPNDPKAIEREVQRLVVRGPAVFVYEAGPCGYALYRQITQMDRRCAVVAPGLIPKRPTDRVKNDRRDAEKLARLYRAGELTEVRVPTPEPTWTGKPFGHQVEGLSICGNYSCVSEGVVRGHQLKNLGLVRVV